MDWPNINVQDYLKMRQAALTGNVRHRRKVYGLTQQDIADLLDCSRSRIARIESGEGGYALEELEFLALRFGEQPATLLKAPDELAIALEIAYTNEKTYPVLGPIADCQPPPNTRLTEQTNLFFSPDHTLLAANLKTEGATEAVCVWDTRTGNVQNVIPLDSYASAIAFSPDGQWLAIGTDMDAVLIWDRAQNSSITCLDPVDDGYPELLWEFVNDCGQGYGLITALEFSPDGTFLAAVNEDHGTLRLWQTGQWIAVDTWALPEMFEALERRRVDFKVVEEEDRTPFGEFPVRRIAFTPDSRQVVVLPLYARQLEHFSLSRQHLRGEMFPEQVKCFAIQALDRSQTKLLYAAGGANQLLEIWYQDDHSWQALYTSSGEAGAIQQIAIVDEHCVLGLVKKSHQPAPFWVIKNLLSNQPVALPDVNPGPFDSIQLAGDGSAVAYLNSDRIKIQQLHPDHLQTPSDRIPQRIFQKQFDERWWPAESGTFDLADGEARQLEVKPHYFPPTVPVIPDFNSKLEAHLYHLKTATPSAEGGYGLAILPLGDQTTLYNCVDRIKANTSEQVSLVELPPRGPLIKVRTLVGYIVGRPLKHGEFTPDITARFQIERPYTIIFIDKAERLHDETLAWICGHMRAVTDLFILVTRDEESFVEMAGRVPGGAMWSLGRAMRVDLQRMLWEE